MISSSSRSLLAFLSIAAFAAPSFAGIIAPGGFAPFGGPGTPASGTLLVSDTKPYSGVNTASQVVFSGTETTKVYSNDPGNGFGGLTFVYQLINSSNSLDAIDRVSLSSFTGFLTDVEFAGTGTAPSFADRSSNGDIVGFDFFGATLTPGATTTTLIIRTNALQYTPNTMSVTDGGTGVVASFGAAINGGSTPEPASLGIMSIGGLLLLRRRR
ncbi:MAG TPA: PEP-CTERM sorting domain-containing protein [Phycisphaerae bacterium]|nr:PEP-CTERM sorting domain-containing protein [Phycisphaerae bacterium]